MFGRTVPPFPGSEEPTGTVKRTGTGGSSPAGIRNQVTPTMIGTIGRFHPPRVRKSRPGQLRESGLEDPVLEVAEGK